MNNFGFNVEESFLHRESSFRGNSSGGVFTVIGSQQDDTIRFSITADNMLRVVSEIDGDRKSEKHSLTGINKLRVIAKSGNDVVINKTSIASEFLGGGGDDRLVGGDGNDDIRGGFGKDMIIGGAGDDVLFGENGRDTLDGKGGRDVHNGGAGIDTIFETFGEDTTLDEEDGNFIQTTFFVGNNSDVDDGNFVGDELSFREAVRRSTDDDIITFKRLIKSGPVNIDIRNDAFRFDSDISIQSGGERNQVVFNGSRQRGTRKFFSVEGGANVEIDSVTIEEFSANHGGGAARIRKGMLTVRNVLVQDNSTSNQGGAFFNDSKGYLYVTDGSVLKNNTARRENGAEDRIDNGGAIYNLGFSRIENSTVKSNLAGSYGGGIYCRNGALEIDSSTIRDNQSNYRGGGIFIGNGNLRIVASALSANRAKKQSGGIRIEPDSDVEIDSSVIRGNYATEEGGGISCHGSVLDITSSTVRNNQTSRRSGGGGFLQASRVLIDSSTFSHNQSGGSGGCFYANNCRSLKIVTSTIANNEGVHGGGIYVQQGGAIIESSTISGNIARGSGGGISSSSLRELSVTNSTISHNRSTRAGAAIGFVNQIVSASFTNTTIAHNVAEEAESGGISFGSSQQAAIFNNSIIFGNTAGGAVADFVDSKGIDHANSHSNLIGEAGGGGFTDGDNGNIVGVVDAGLATELEDNGGPTMTLRLEEDSIAKNAGSTNLAKDSNGELLAFDQRGQGFDRFKDGSVDIGAFEL